MIKIICLMKERVSAAVSIYLLGSDGCKKEKTTSNHVDIEREKDCYLRNQITIFIFHTGLENTRPLIQLEVKIDIGPKNKESAERNI